MASRNGKLADEDKLVTRGQLERVLNQVVKRHLDLHHQPPAPWKQRVAIWWWSSRLGRKVHVFRLQRALAKARVLREDELQKAQDAPLPSDAKALRTQP